MSDNAAVAVVERTPVMELAAKAAEEIRTRGWTQGTLASGPFLQSCRVCLFGALNAAYTGCPTAAPSGEYHTVYGMTVRALRDHLGLGGYMHDLVLWNDDRGRSVDEVLAVLDAVSEGDGNRAAADADAVAEGH